MFKPAPRMIPASMAEAAQLPARNQKPVLNNKSPTIVRDLDRRGIAVAVEGSPLTRPDDCGTNLESWGA